MNRLAWWLVRAQFATRRTATTLSMLAIGLGVALGYAIHLINAAALDDFSRAMTTLQGAPDAVIAPRDSGGRVPIELIDELARDPAVLVIAPVIETRVRIGDGTTPVRLLGLDVFSAAAVMPALLPAGSALRDTGGAPAAGGKNGNTGATAGANAPATTGNAASRDPGAASAQGNFLDGAVYASPALLARLDLAPGDTITLRRGEASWPATLAGELPATRREDLLLVADIAWVQAHFGPPDGVSEGRLRLAPDANLKQWLAGWAPRLPAGLVLRAAADDSTRVANMSRAYRVNLNVLALVALLTGAFLVFATQLTAVAQRSTQFALLGVLGLSPRRRFLQVLLEGLAIGLPGALAGLALGYGLALTFTRLVGGDLGGGYFAASSPQLEFRWLPAAGFLALGCAASLAGAFYPAWLNRIQPLAQALKTGFAQRPPSGANSDGDKRRRRGPGRGTLIALLGLAAFGLTRLPPIAELPLAGYAAIALVLTLGVLAAPLGTQLVFGGIGRLPLPAPQRVALQNVVQAPLMAQVAASGLIVSFALTVSMVTMVASFRLAVDEWLDVVLPAPLYLRGKGLPLPRELLADLASPAAPFARVLRGSNGQLTLDPRRPPVALVVRDLDRASPAERLPFTGEVVAVPASRVAVWVSEPLQDLYGFAPGQAIRLPLLGREVEATVGGVFRDYARQFGAVVISSADYVALGGRFEPSELALWPRAGQEAAAKDWLATQAVRHGAEMADSRELRALSLKIFDHSFAVTYALEAAAMLIGLFGLAVTLAASVWLRARELATLNALGFDRAMLTRAVLTEGALIASIGLLIGLACGLGIGAILTGVVNPQAFHWRMALTVPWLQVLAAALLTLAAGLAASRFAARLATRLPAAQVLADAQ